MLDFAFQAPPRTAPPAPSGAAPSTPPVAGNINSAVLARMLDVVDYGVVLVDEDGTILFINRVARAEMNDEHPLQALGGRLRVRHSQDVSTLRTAIFEACTRGLQKLLTLGHSSADAFNVSVVPVLDACGSQAAALLVFGRHAFCGDLTIAAFARRHQLTSAELRVLKFLCAGLAPSDIARLQGVALCTVRTQIGGLRAKTGSQSIGSLVRQIARLPPLPALHFVGQSGTVRESHGA